MAIVALVLLGPLLARTVLAIHVQRRRSGTTSLKAVVQSFFLSVGAMIPILSVAYSMAIIGCIVMMLTAPLWHPQSRQDELQAAAMYVGAAFALAGGCLGFWITRPRA